MPKHIRYLNQEQRQRISHDLVLTRIGELMYRGLNVMVRSLIYPGSGKSAFIIEGFKITINSGMIIDISAPMVAVQNIGNDDVLIAFDDQNNSSVQITLDNGDGSNSRIDIIEARISRRTTFTDIAADRADPVTQAITPFTVDRDVEIYIELQKKNGSPSPSPTPPSPTIATVGILNGTVIITGTIDLSNRFILNLAINSDSEFIEIDLRGVSPSATTLIEIRDNINAAGFGTIASIVANKIIITASGTGENSSVQVKQPLDTTKDAYGIVTGQTITLGYFDKFTGVNAFFKIGEILVPIGITSLDSGNLRSIEIKDTAWSADASTIENAFSLEGHRKSVPADHAPASITAELLDPSVSASITGKLVKFRKSPDGLNGIFPPIRAEPIFPVIFDTTFLKGRAMKNDTAMVSNTGIIEALESSVPYNDVNFNNRTATEQNRPIKRVDQREETLTGPGYNVPVTSSESASDQRAFVPGNTVNAAGPLITNIYKVQVYAEFHTRLGIFITNGAAITGFTNLQITLHDAGNNVLASNNILRTALVTLNSGWIYINLVFKLVVGQTYHYHFNITGITGGITTPILANVSGSGANTLAFRQMYDPQQNAFLIAGFLGSTFQGSFNQEDVLQLIDDEGFNVRGIERITGEDNIIGDGSDGSGWNGKADVGVNNIDTMAVDFSNDSFWQSWRYEHYIGIDLTNSRFKIPPGYKGRTAFDIRRIVAQFNINESIAEFDSKNLTDHNFTTIHSVDNIIRRLNEGYNVIRIDSIKEDVTTGITAGIINGSDVVIFPAAIVPNPKGTFQFIARNPGSLKPYDIRIALIFSMSINQGGRFLEFILSWKVNNFLVQSASIIKTSPNITLLSFAISKGDTNDIDLTNGSLDASLFNEGDLITVDIERNLTGGDTHDGDANIFGIHII